MSIARVVADAFESQDQLVIFHARGPVLQLSHALIDERKEVGEAIRNRRVGGKTERFRIGSLDAGPAGTFPVLHVHSLGHGDGFGEDFHLLFHPGPRAENDVDHLLEIEQPKRQLQISGIEHLRVFGKAPVVLIVTIEQEDAHVRPYLQHLSEYQDDATRLSHSGGAEHGKMPAQQLVHVNIGGQCCILLQPADVDRVISIRAVHDAQLVAAYGHDGIADQRIFGNAAQKVRRATAVGLDLTHEVEASRRYVTLVASDLRHFHANLRDKSDQNRIVAYDGEEFSDRGAFSIRHRPVLSEDADTGFRPAYGQHRADVSLGLGNWIFQSVRNPLQVQMRLPEAPLWRNAAQAAAS